MKYTVLSVQPNEFTDRQTGEVRKMWRVYCADSTGAVGSVYSTREIKTGESVDLEIAVNRDGKFVARIKPTAVDAINQAVDNSARGANNGVSRAKVPD